MLLGDSLVGSGTQGFGLDIATFGGIEVGPIRFRIRIRIGSRFACRGGASDTMFALVLCP